MSRQVKVSICMPTYNQARFVRKALISAFQQTYSPLEIVIADDCSTDGTPQIIESTIEEFRSYNEAKGHQVVFVKNAQNKGCVGNFENVFTLARGELLIDFGGDDIADERRVEQIVVAWVQDGERAGVIVHSGVYIDSDDKYIGDIKPRGAATFPIGAITVYHKKTITEFPAITELKGWEDHIFGLRGELIGGCLHMPDRLVKKRIGAGTSSGGNRRQISYKIAKATACGRRQNLKDLEFYRPKMSEEDYLKWKKTVLSWLDYEESMETLCGSDSLFVRLKSAIHLLSIKKSFKVRTLILIRILPHWMCDAIMSLKR